MQYNINITINKFNSINQMDTSDKQLLMHAVKATSLAYAPYSNFKVGAAALLNSGIILCGSNQENASFGATICAERALISNIAMNHPNEQIMAIAVSYLDENNLANPKLLSPCGICRQSLLEIELNNHKPIKIIMGSLIGEIYIINSVKSLLPLAFSVENLTLTNKAQL